MILLKANMRKSFIFDRVDQPVVSRVHEDIEKGLELPEAVKKVRLS